MIDLFGDESNNEVEEYDEKFKKWLSKKSTKIKLAFLKRDLLELDGKIIIAKSKQNVTNKT